MAWGVEMAWDCGVGQLGGFVGMRGSGGWLLGEGDGAVIARGCGKRAG